MSQIKRSPIRLERIELRSVSFEAHSSKLHRVDIPVTAIEIFLAQLDAPTPLSVVTECTIDLFTKYDRKPDFTAHLTYHICAAVEDVQGVELLMKFSKVGAAFNAFVFAREAIAGLTFKAFGKVARLPLLNISEIGPRIQMRSKSVASESGNIITSAEGAAEFNE